MHIFPPIRKKNAYFSQIDLKFTKFKKKAENFSRRAPKCNKVNIKYKSNILIYKYTIKQAQDSGKAFYCDCSICGLFGAYSTSQ